MRIRNIAGNGSWQPVPLAPRNAVALTIQNSGAVDTQLRYANNPTETFTIKSGTTLEVHVRPEQDSQVQVSAASGTIQIHVGSITN